MSVNKFQSIEVATEEGVIVAAGEILYAKWRLSNNTWINLTEINLPVQQKGVGTLITMVDADGVIVNGRASQDLDVRKGDWLRFHPHGIMIKHGS